MTNDNLPGVHPVLATLIISLASLCCSCSWDGSFVFDDYPAIINNPDVSSRSLSTIFTNDFWGSKLTHNQSHGSYRPFIVLTFRLHHWTRGYLNPRDFHISNLVLHTTACILLYFVLKKILSKQDHHLAFYTATLFAVHPIHCEAVAGIVGRADILCAIFVWLAFLLYYRCLHSKYPFKIAWNILLCGLAIALAILCKEIGITAIGICLTYDLVIVNKKNFYDLLNLQRWVVNRNCVCSITLVAIGLLLLGIRFSLMGFKAPTFQPIDNPASFMEGSLLRHLNYEYIYSLNSWLLVCPEWLSFDWSMGCVPLITDWDPRLLNIVLLWSMLSPLVIKNCFAVETNRQNRYVTMGLCMMIVPFLPASNLFFNVGFVLAERTLYLPSAGYCFIVAVGLQKLCRCFPASRVPLVMYVVLILTWFSRSWIRSGQWKEEQSLFRSALSVCPLNAKVHYNVAKNAGDLGNTSLAEAEYQEALRLNPEYTQAMNNLGNLLKDQERFFEAKKILQRAVKLQPDFAAAWMNLGIVLSALKAYDEAEECYKMSLFHRKHCPDCQYNLGLLYLQQNETSKALIAWANAIKQDPKHRRAWTNTIRLLDDIGMVERALNNGRKAIELLPNDANIRLNVGNILGKLGRYEESKKEFLYAAKLDPVNPSIYTNLGVLYHRWNKFTQAKEMYLKALDINPHAQTAKENLMNLMKKKKTKLTG